MVFISLLIIGAVIISAVFHEYAHGWVAYKLGDHTAKNAGRLTLNPIPHLDPMGSILLPLLLALSPSPAILAWAKPVPYNPANLSDLKYGDLKVALGGPGSNFILALFFGLLARFLPLAANLKINLVNAFFGADFNAVLSAIQGDLLGAVFLLSLVMCFVNLILMIFNLLPIPPLDGSKVLMTFLPGEWRMRMMSIEPYGIFIILALIFFFGLGRLISVLLFFLLKLIIGF
ncbi:MAG: site-2 protease family protein [Patescibacteria group bacterium]